MGRLNLVTTKRYARGCWHAVRNRSTLPTQALTDGSMTTNAIAATTTVANNAIPASLTPTGKIRSCRTMVTNNTSAAIANGAINTTYADGITDAITINAVEKMKI